MLTIPNSGKEDSFLQENAWKKIEESEERFRTMANEAPLFVWVTDENLQTTFLNKTGLNYFNLGYDIDLAGLSWKKFIHPEDLGRVLDEMKNAAEKQQPYSLEMRLKNGATGKYRWFLDKGVPRYSNNKLAGFIGTSLDIHDRKEAENEIKEREAQLNELANAMPQLVWMANGEGNIIYYNNRIADYGVVQLADGKWSWQSMLHPGDLASTILHWNNAVRNGTAYQKEHRIKMADGTCKWHLSRAFPQKDAAGNIIKWFGTATDIDEQKKISESIRVNEEKLKVAIEAAEMGTWEYDLVNDVIECSERTIELFGFTPGTKISLKTVLDIIDEKDRERVTCAVQAALAHGSDGNYDVEYSFTNYRDHTLRSVKAKGKVFFDGSGIAYRLTGTLLDITKQKETIHSLAYGKALLEAHYEATADGILLIGADGKLLSYNRRFTEMWDIPQSIIQAQDNEAALAFIMNRLEEPEILMEKIKFLYENPVPVSINELVFKNGKIVECHAYPVADKDKGFNAWSWNFRDVTASKLYEKTIRESEERFRLLANSIPQIVWTTTAGGVCGYISSQWYKYTGQWEDDGINTFANYIHPDDLPIVINNWNESVKTGNPYITEYRLKNVQTGEYHWFIANTLPLKDEYGNIVKWVGAATNIHEIKMQEQRKDDFIKMASHELNTPVTSIKGYVQLLLKMHENSEDAFLRQALSAVDRQIVKLAKLISDLLDVTRIESGKLITTKAGFIINELVKETIADLKTVTPHHSIVFNDIEPLTVHADKDRIGQVITNLLGNAVKYSPGADKIIIGISQIAGDVIIKVEDFGIGIDADDQTRIFERFYRVYGKNEQTFPGFGIGLFIVSEIIKQHDGKIWVTSEKNKGSSFYFSLPLRSIRHGQ